VGKASRQRWNHDLIPEMGSLDSLSMVFLQREYRVRRRRPPGKGYRVRITPIPSIDDARRSSRNRAFPPLQCRPFAQLDWTPYCG
jgi:hypothetical protein